MRIIEGHTIYCDHQELTWYYKKVKGYTEPDDMWQNIYFKKYATLAYKLLKDMANNDLSLAKQIIDKTKEYCLSQNLSWNLETVINLYPEINELMLKNNDNEDIKKKLKEKAEIESKKIDEFDKKFSIEEIERAHEYLKNLPGFEGFKKAVNDQLQKAKSES